MPKKKNNADKQFVFATSHEKAQSRIAINSTMIGLVFFIITIIFTLGPDKVSPVILAELILSIPLLFVATLAYSKISYWHDSKAWDTFGWLISSIGNCLLLNSVGLMAGLLNRPLAFVYFYLLLGLMAVYTFINIYFSHDKKGAGKIFKLIFFLSATIFGGLIFLL